jgi:hypothetical protein
MVLGLTMVFKKVGKPFQQFIRQWGFCAHALPVKKKNRQFLHISLPGNFQKTADFFHNGIDPGQIQKPSKFLGSVS